MAIGGQGGKAMACVNIANHVNFATPDNNLQDNTFGQILGDVSPRILEFALKYTL